MPHHDIVVIGASAGGLAAVRQLVAGLPGDLPAALVVTLHLNSDFDTRIPQMITPNGGARADFAKHGEKVMSGRIYVAPRNRHLLLDGDRLYIGTGPHENGTRPAIDPLFRSAALCCGPRAIGVLLSGNLNDGSSGLRAIRRCGGIGVVQDPDDADFPDMPRNAIAYGEADHVVPLAAMPRLLEELVAKHAGRRRAVPPDIRTEVAIAARGASDISITEALGDRSLLACPTCHGVLWELKDGKEMRYRCHVGHAFTGHSLDLMLRDDLSRALASAVRVLDERGALVRRLATEARQRGQATTRSWDDRAAAYDKQAALVRRVLQQMETHPEVALSQRGEVRETAD